TIVDTLNGNGNGKAEPGETAQMWVTLSNAVPFATAENVQATLSTTDPEVIITTATANFPNIPAGATVNNQNNPFVFDVAATLEAHYVTFTLNVTSNGGTYQVTHNFQTMIGLPDYLIVADDGGGGWVQHYINDFNTLGEVCDVWDVNSQGSPSFDDLNWYPNVIWMTGQSSSTLTTYEQEVIADYLDAGNCLFISSQNLNDDIGTSAFYQDYMHATSVQNFIATTTMTGEAGSPVGNGTTLILVGGAYWPSSSSAILPDAEAVAAYRYNNPAQNIGALTYDGNYRLVYFAFSYECISPTTASYTQRPQIMSNIMDWFAEWGPAYPDVDVILSPINPPIQIPANGGSFSYNIGIANNEATAVTVDIWSYVTLPNGSQFGPIINFGPTTRPPGSSASRERIQNVPAGAPAGAYTYDAYVGDYPNEIWDEAYFDFEKLAVSDGGPVVSDWNSWGEEFGTLCSGEDVMKVSEFKLNNPYPNPFNPETVISFTIPAETEVTLMIYNAAGREVAILVDGNIPKGEYSMNFNAENLASGIYFAQLKADNNIQTVKLLLAK
ncbi:MAG: T9SS type A sorting domain-containing protein, partial [FCB group bacterium]|nr:T9SS type A sorting domain-containing protein [FCB group bacterium]